MNDLDPISKAFDTETPIGKIDRPGNQLIPKPGEEVPEAPEIEEDFQEARANLRELISQAMEQIPDMINLMQQSQSDKMISAVSSFIKTAADLNTSLSKLSKEIKRQPKAGKGQTNEDSPQQVTHNHNAVYVGSTEDFLRMLNKRRLEDSVDAEFVEIKKDED